MLWLKTVIIGRFACEQSGTDKVFRRLKTYVASAVLNSDLRFHESSFIFTKFYFIFFQFSLAEFPFCSSLTVFFYLFIFLHGLETQGGLCKYQHVSNQHDVDRICNTAHHLNNGCYLETAQIRILGVRDEFRDKQVVSPQKENVLFSPKTEFQSVSMFLTIDSIFIIYVCKFRPRLRDQGNHRARRAS